MILMTLKSSYSHLDADMLEPRDLNKFSTTCPKTQPPSTAQPVALYSIPLNKGPCFKNMPMLVPIYFNIPIDPNRSEKKVVDLNQQLLYTNPPFWSNGPVDLLLG